MLPINTKVIDISGIKIGGGHPFVFIGGPCVIEGEKSALETAEQLIDITKKAGVPYIYKSSYDKANRTSVNSYRGPGLKEGLLILKKVKDRFGIPVLSDIHSEGEIPYAAEILDIIQIPAFLCRQTDILLAAADTKRAVNIKKGQFMAPWDMKNVIKKVESRGNNNILVTDRGTSFGYNYLVSDLRALPIMRGFGYPVVYDATHSVQLPGGNNDKSGGERHFVYPLAKAAAAVGCDAIFMEVHPDPDNALSDGPNMLKIDALYDVLVKLKEIDNIIKR